jgi:hypothetical protein
MSRSGFAEKNNPLKDRSIPSKTQNDGDHSMESTGISLTDALPNDNTFNAECCRVNTLTKLLPLRLQVDGEDLLFMLTTQYPTPPENSKPFAKKIGAASLYTHCMYSPDLAPSEFFLFGHTKHHLQGIAFPSREELFTAIHGIVRAIPRLTLGDLFRHWMERLEWVSQNNGNHYP